ncbi:ADP-ribosylation factor-binding protein GGA2 isoform X2 [Malaya genurostris]|uniref:ADP-ribosylation factor-binding protein GGA2 isoform X2 n=1 Tax=Malaya genurostris TaxID=325434 RepID=UPI0026F3B8DA|nr:ADP-ribosylation factor-binding protein GGA2 isoform X2 [Malaya genurostris]
MDPDTALDSYLGKAVHPSNTDLDISAIDQFCLTLKKNPSFMHRATQLLAKRIQSSSTKEALFTLEALEECMETCGIEFRSEINKFRFLNELIKLVSRKFDGDKTPREVSERILNILLTWTNKYESCNKIQEAYNLLKTQGIEHQPQQNVVVKSTPKSDSRGSLEDSELAKLRKLINSSKQEDRDMANLLIQNFYRDDERRTQMKARRLSELQKVSENTKLLDEMLSQYRADESSEEELAIIRDIFQSCEGMHPTIIRLAEETQHSEGMLEKIFEVNDNLTQVLDKYRQLILNNNKQTGRKFDPSPTKSSLPSKSQSNASLETSYTANVVGSDPLDTLFDISTIPSNSDAARSTFEDLSEIFSTSVSTDESHKKSDLSSSKAAALNTETILTPVMINNGPAPSNIFPGVSTTTNGLNKYRDLNNLLQTNNVNGKMENSPKTTPTNIVDRRSVSLNTKSTIVESSASTEKSIPGLDLLVSGMKSTLLSNNTSAESQDEPISDRIHAIEVDDILLETVAHEVPQSCINAAEDSPVLISVKPQFKSLAEIVIDLDNIQPSREPSRTVWDDKEGLQITLNFAKDHPRSDVSVIVISTINQGRVEIPEFHFDASVRKPCKLRLLPASGSSLPGTKPFRPPADGITQVLLLANPNGEPVDLTCILNYCVGDDPDPIKESIVITGVPFTRE